MKLHLQPNQVLQLFFWIEESVYRFQPQKYFVFLLKVLEKEENLIWLPKEQAQDFWKKLMELGIEEAGSKKFRMLYMEKEEREKFYKEQEETAKQKKVAELEKQTKEAYQHFLETAAGENSRRDFLENRIHFSILIKKKPI